MSVRPLILDSIAFTYPGSTIPVFTGLSAHFPVGWTGIVGANGCGKTTLLHIVAGLLVPERGIVISNNKVVLCSQRTDDPPESFDTFIGAMDTDAYRLRGELGICEDWAERWETLSHGERKRAQIANALWRRPQLLVVDEPTNHIDIDAWRMLMSALGAYGGVGIIVSHDRMLLDTLCRQSLFLGDHPVMRPGGYSQGMAEQDRELTERQHERDIALADLRKLKREKSNRRREASRADRRRSKRGLARKDHDARFKINMARVTGKDGTAGRLLRQLEGRMAQAEKRLEKTTVPRDRELGIHFEGSLARRDYLWRLPDEALPLGTGHVLVHPAIAMRPMDRVAITGSNGTGKSTLIGHIVAKLDLPTERLVYLPQEISAVASRKLIDEVRGLSSIERGRVMQLVSHLNSCPERLLETALPSPGEVRKLMIARGIACEPWLLIMDEPTNHLDLPSIRCLEEALTGYPCGLLLVSHDLPFLAATTTHRWHIVRKPDGMHELKTDI